MNVAAPVLDGRQADEFFAELVRRGSGYVPPFRPTSGGPGSAALHVYARYLQALAERVNRSPSKNRLAFFDLLGVSLLTTQAAVAPVVFKPLSQLGDARVPARTQVAANLPGRDEPLVFETTAAIALAAAQLVEVVSFWPGKDAWADHSTAALGEQPFVPFTGLKPTPHELYLAHDIHFALAGEATVELQFELAQVGSQPVELEWQYWDGDLWRAFKAFVAPVDASPTDSLDGTDGLTRNGTVRLAADCAKTARTRINGVTTFWVRGRSVEPLPPAPDRKLPVVHRISVRTVLDNSGLTADAAFVDGLKLDPAKTFYPFGQQPQPGTAFYVSNAEAFTKPGASVTLSASVAATPLDDSGSGASTSASPTLIADYWNGFVWSDLGLTSDALTNFIKGKGLTFTIPADMESTSVNGKDGAWLRMRIASGGFYRTRTITWTVPSPDGPIPNTIVVSETVPPALKDFSLAYTYESPRDPPQACAVYSDFQWTDRTEEATWRGNTFEPFTVTQDSTPALYFGFDRPLPIDFVNLYLDIEEQPDAQSGPVLRWEAFDGRDWLPVVAVDETAHLARPGMAGVTWPGERPRASGEAIQAVGNRVQLASTQQAAAFRRGQLVLVGTVDNGELATVGSVEKDSLVLAAPLGQAYQRVAVAVALLPRFGTPRAWLRARLQSDGEPLRSQINGVFFNAVWAEQVRTYSSEVLGASNGQPSLTVFFKHTPVLPGEVVEVRELSGPRAAVELPILLQELARLNVSADAVRTVTDPRSGAITEAWVHWERRPNLFFSGPDDRHYTIERSRGRVTFGDGVHGRIPPAGPDGIRAQTYPSGGGAIGNVPAGALSQLLSGVPAAGATNPRAGEGGADGETSTEVDLRAPLVTRHRNQALSLADYEALAREASPSVAVARALPTTHPSGRPTPGWVKVIIQPHSQDPRPQPSFGLRRRVAEYLLARIPASMGGQISIVGPDYLQVGVEARVVPVDVRRAGEVHDSVVRALAAFLHPVTGGPEGTGWPFGRDVYISDVAGVIEGVSGVDYVPNLNLLLDATPQGDIVSVPQDRMVVAGALRVTIWGSGD